MDQAKPGDVICYGSGEETSAAGIYVGDGKMVQASETRGKVVIVKIDPEQESFALELFEDTKVIAGSKNISEVNATEAMYGQDLGLFKLTYYCACAKCWKGNRNYCFRSEGRGRGNDRGGSFGDSLWNESYY